MGKLMRCAGAAVGIVIALWNSPVHEPVRPGIVFVADGVGGFDVLGLVAEHVLPKAGVTHEIRRFVWQHGTGHYLRDLQDIRYMLDKAEELAVEVRRVKVEDPNRRIFLVGRSGGAGLVLATAELLPPDTIEHMVLLSAAVAPHYDLRPALRATHGQIISYYSDHDQVVLNWGTREFGTIDRWYGPSAGLHGFRVPEDLSAADRHLYDRLVQVPWRASMIFEGHLGTHAGTNAPAFVAREVATWLKP